MMLRLRFHADVGAATRVSLIRLLFLCLGPNQGGIEATRTILKLYQNSCDIAPDGAMLGARPGERITVLRFAQLIRRRAVRRSG